MSDSGCKNTGSKEIEIEGVRKRQTRSRRNRGKCKTDNRDKCRKEVMRPLREKGKEIKSENEIVYNIYHLYQK